MVDVLTRLPLPLTLPALRAGSLPLPQGEGGVTWHSCRRVDAHQMPHAVDHAAHRGRVLEHARAAQLVEAEALQGRALIGLAADRARDLRHAEGLLRHLPGPG